jgi:hypothetical protein
VTNDQLAALAIECGAMVLGDAGSRQQFMFSVEQLARFREAIPPCPVPMPSAAVKIVAA